MVISALSRTVFIKDGMKDRLSRTAFIKDGMKDRLSAFIVSFIPPLAILLHHNSDEFVKWSRNSGSDGLFITLTGTFEKTFLQFHG